MADAPPTLRAGRSFQSTGVDSTSWQVVCTTVAGSSIPHFTH